MRLAGKWKEGGGEKGREVSPVGERASIGRAYIKSGKGGEGGINVSGRALLERAGMYCPGDENQRRTEKAYVESFYQGNPNKNENRQKTRAFVARGRERRKVQKSW